MNRNSKDARIRLLQVVLLLISILAGGLLFAQKPSFPKQETVSIKGRTLAGVDYLTGFLRGGLGDHYEVFVFGLEPPHQGSPVVPVKVMYKFFQSESALPESFLDASRRYELYVVRQPNCDETVQSLSYEKNYDETGKPLSPSYILRPLNGAPNAVLKRPDLALACYVMRPGKYKVLSQDAVATAKRWVLQTAPSIQEGNSTASLLGSVVRYDAPMSTRTSQADMILKLKSEGENKYL